MRLFGRKSESPADPAPAIERFWAWWAEARPELDAAVTAGETGRQAELIGPAVTAVHPSLVWEITPGLRADHALVVTCAGDPELRAVAHRWAAAAPPADRLWEFHPSRRADPRATTLTVDVDGYGFTLGELTLGLRVPRGNPRVDVVAYHPIFTLLPEETRVEAALLALDRLLGEDEVARWVGDVSAVAIEPMDAVPAVHLPGVVADLASGYGDDQWALLEGETAGGARLVAAARHPLRPVDYPVFDQHIAITLPYAHHDAEGLPTGPSLEALRDFEERLAGRIGGPDGGGVLAAHLSAEGRRVLHVYADPEGRAAVHAEKLVAGWKEGRPRVDVAADPGWAAVAPFLS
ncbi:hypothetical protein FHS43_005220 [Streptosporangium becharense]|uniref:DUF695 domain-containing protein n=1 Tax=Streptosporangium becharense TaxID=1816182 RepID=A0A7W9MHS2_9ACTN|nr:DUF695 domain-containing protein [Streptosporangium becharense]MBB2913911.1 hypothetical protein [Streptosporangium becharense]MBB5821427.1 hypothetical protein [Streptosporangium becharense]